MSSICFVSAASRATVAIDSSAAGSDGKDLVGFTQGIPLALFMLGAGLRIRETAALPRWTSFLALASVPFLIVGSASIAGREVDGGPFTVPLMLAYLGMLVWTVAVSVVLRRRPTVRHVEVVTTPA
jgi:hypothetical protein